MNRTPRSSIVRRSTPWLIAAALLLSAMPRVSARDIAGDDEKIPWGVRVYNPRSARSGGQSIQITEPFWNFIENSRSIDRAKWAGMPFQDQYKQVVTQSKDADAAFKRGKELYDRIEREMLKSEGPKLSNYTKFRMLNQLYKETGPLVNEVTKSLGKAQAFGVEESGDDGDGHFYQKSAYLPDLYERLRRKSQEASKGLNKEDSENFAKITKKQVESKKSRQAKETAEAAMKAKNDADAAKRGRELFEGPGLKNRKPGRGVQRRSAAALVAPSGMAPGVLQKDADAGLANAPVADIAAPPEKKGFWSKVGDFFKKIPVPVLLGLGGALVGGLIGGTKGMLIGAGGGLVLGLGLGVLKNATAPKGAYGDELKKANDAIHDNEKQDKKISSPTVAWYKDLENVRAEEATVDLDLKNIDKEGEELGNKLVKKEITRDQYNDKMKVVEARAEALKDKQDELKRRDAVLETKRKDMEGNIDQHEKLRLQRASLEEKANSLRQKNDAAKDSDRLLVEASDKSKKVAEMRAQAKIDAETHTGTFEERSKKWANAKKLEEDALKLEGEAKAAREKSAAIETKFTSEPKPDPMKKAQLEAEMKRVEQLASPKYDFKNDSELAARYKDCDVKKDGPRCAFGKTAAALQAKPNPTPMDIEMGKKAAWCAAQSTIDTHIEGCSKPMLYEKLGEAKRTDKVPDASGFKKLFGSKCVWYNDGEYQISKRAYEYPGAHVVEVWKCEGGKPFFQGKEVAGTGCNVSTCGK